MTVRLPLFPIVDAPVEVLPAKARDPRCTQCELSSATTTVCLPGHGEPGGLLVVAPYSTRFDDDCGEAFRSTTFAWVAQVVSRYWQGPVYYDTAVRCRSKGAPTQASIEACRNYLTHTIEQVQPKRILALGTVAMQSLLGRSEQSLSVRKGYGWLSDGTPVYLMQNPLAVMRNRFLRRWLEHDILTALTRPIPDTPPWAESCTVVGAVDEAEACVAACREDGWLAYDTETSGALFDSYFEIAALAVTPGNGDRSWVWSRESLADPALVEPLRRLLEDPSVGKVGHNVKYDMEAVRCGLDVVVGGVIGDTRLWRKSNFSDAVAGLDTCAELVGMGGHKAEMKRALKAAVTWVHKVRRWVGKLDDDQRAQIASQFQSLVAGASIGRPWERTADSESQALAILANLGKVVDPPAVYLPLAASAVLTHHSPKAFAFALVEDEVMLRYCALDTITTARLARLYMPKVESFEPAKRVFESILNPVIPVFEQIEAWGMGIDDNAMKTFREHLTEREQDLTQKLGAYGDFNPASPKDLQRVLFHELGLPVQKETRKGAASTDKSSLENLRALHPIADLLLEYRRVTKMLGTYAVGLTSHLRADGRIHPTFNLAGARTGRLSCSNPNLQNIPRKGSVEGRMLKDCFVAGPGKVLAQFDYSQLELRVAAILSEDQKMADIYKSGIDYHLRTAQMIAPTAWGLKPEDIKPGSEHRTAAKAVNFGLLYGMEVGTLADNIGCSREKADTIRQAILGEFRVLAQWIQGCLREVRNTGFAWTYWFDESGTWHRARRRDLFDVAEEEGYVRSRAEHGSFNTPVQGTASDFMLVSLKRIVDWLHEDAVPARIVTTVHDSVVLEVERSALEEVVWNVKDLMSDFPTRNVPLVVDAEVGPSWGSLTDVAIAPGGGLVYPRLTAALDLDERARRFAAEMGVDVRNDRAIE